MIKQDRSSNKDIAQNAFLLYIRMAVMMLIQIYTSRLILIALGVSDYGLYNVIGGIVVMFSFLNGALSGSTQRYLTYELGRGDYKRLQTIFSSSLQLHFCIALIIIIISEPVGLWFIYNEMQIPKGQLSTAVWVFQVSMITFFVSVIAVPYNSVIIAHERMSVFAYLSIAEGVLKLIIVYLLLMIDKNRLIAYSLYTFLVSLGILLLYFSYCRKNFEETRYTHLLDKELLRSMMSFSGWNLLGHIAAVLNTQGLNLLLNIYFGPVANAARGIAVQVQVTLNQFCGNFLTAVNPELTKSYAAGEYEKSISLMFRASRFAFYLLLLVILPVFIEANGILSIWLKEVPPSTAVYLRILLLCLLIWTYTNPMTTVAYATGHIRKLNIVCGLIVLSALPVSWILLEIGFPSYSVFVVVFVLEIISLFARILILRNVVNFSIRSFISDVLFRTFVVGLTSIILPVVLHFYLTPSIINTIAICIISVFSVIFCALCFGMNRTERLFLYGFIQSKLFLRKV